MISNPAKRIGLLRPTSSVAVPSAGSPPDTHTQTLSSCCVYVFVFVCMYVSVCVCVCVCRVCVALDGERRRVNQLK